MANGWHVSVVQWPDQVEVAATCFDTPVMWGFLSDYELLTMNAFRISEWI